MKAGKGEAEEEGEGQRRRFGEKTVAMLLKRRHGSEKGPGYGRGEDGGGGAGSRRARRRAWGGRADARGRHLGGLRVSEDELYEGDDVDEGVDVVSRQGSDESARRGRIIRDGQGLVVLWAKGPEDLVRREAGEGSRERKTDLGVRDERLLQLPQPEFQQASRAVRIVHPSQVVRSAIDPVFQERDPVPVARYAEDALGRGASEGEDCVGEEEDDERDTR